MSSFGVDTNRWTTPTSLVNEFKILFSQIFTLYHMILTHWQKVTCVTLVMTVMKYVTHTIFGASFIYIYIYIYVICYVFILTRHAGYRMMHVVSLVCNQLRDKTKCYFSASSRVFCILWNNLTSATALAWFHVMFCFLNFFILFFSYCGTFCQLHTVCACCCSMDLLYRPMFSYALPQMHISAACTDSQTDLVSTVSFSFQWLYCK